MTTTTSESVLNALKALFGGSLMATVEKNSEAPEVVPPHGLVIVRDGVPGEPVDPVLGGFDEAYYQHQIDVEIYVSHGIAEERDRRYAELVRNIGDLLKPNKTLGGLIEGMTYGQPAPNTDYIEGAHDVKAATLVLSVEYNTSNPLA